MIRAIFLGLRSAVGLLTAGGWSALVAGTALTVVGLSWGHGETVITGVALVAVVFLAVGWMLRRPMLRASRTIEPARVEEGDEARAVVKLGNNSKRRSPPVAGIDKIDGEPVRFVTGAIAPGEESRQSYTVPTEQRGLHWRGPLSVAHADPFNLVRAGDRQWI